MIEVVWRWLIPELKFQVAIFMGDFFLARGQGCFEFSPWMAGAGCILWMHKKYAFGSLLDRL